MQIWAPVGHNQAITERRRPSAVGPFASSRDPADLLIVLGLSVVSAAFHECGHATGCRYGGARPGVIGVGIYLVWPSFFTNVTDSYRLSRAGRLRTDLGGLYFNLIFILALAGLYSATSAEVLLLVIAVTHLEMLEQLSPFVRFDGYFILSDRRNRRRLADPVPGRFALHRARGWRGGSPPWVCAGPPDVPAAASWSPWPAWGP
jgi:hypothetical protein